MGFQTYIKSCCNNDTNRTYKQLNRTEKKCCILSDKLLQNKKQIIDYFNKPPYRDTKTASTDIQKIAYMQHKSSNSNSNSTRSISMSNKNPKQNKQPMQKCINYSTVDCSRSRRDGCGRKRKKN